MAALGSTSIPPIAALPPHSGYHGPDRTWNAPKPTGDCLGRFFGGGERFFEGWYFRLTLPKGGPSLAFMYSIQDPDTPSPYSGGTVQILDEADRYACRSFPQVDRFWADRHRLALGHWGRCLGSTPTPQPLLPQQFHTRIIEGYQILAQGSNTLHQGRFWDPLRQETVAWSYTLEPVYGWGNPGFPQSTGGWLSALPIFEPGWQVLLASARATGWVEWQGERYDFHQVPAYGEKNWGGAFPDRWFWLNSNTFQSKTPQSKTGTDSPQDPEETGETSDRTREAIPQPIATSSADLSLTVAGGRRSVLGRSEEVGLVGIHTAGKFHEFAPWNSRLGWAVQWGQWRIWAENATHWVEVEATTTEAGAWVRVPTAQGMQFCCRDSLRGQIRLRLGERGADRRSPRLDAWSDRAGVEVGGLAWSGTWHHG
ncbi:MAG: tocopherol cyclase family protein [Prochlorothrix sp.]